LHHLRSAGARCESERSCKNGEGGEGVGFQHGKQNLMPPVILTSFCITSFLYCDLH
jgi:hypothetical protein